MKNCYAYYAVRLGMLFFWICVLIGCLYVPSIWRNVQEDKTIYVATWPLVLDPRVIQAFEQESGIKVQIAYFERSEELFAKIKATGGRGYDIIFPSDFTVKLLIQEKLVAPLDRSRLIFWHDLDERLLGNYFDPQNRYSIPFYWGIFGIGINKKIFASEPPHSWALLFDAAYSKLPLLMTDQAREAVSVAARYLYGSVDALHDVSAQEAVQQLLIAQKARVSLYSSERIDDMLASENCAIAFGLGSDIMRAKIHNEAVSFIVPQEGSFLIIDSIALTNYARQDLVYQFINYLYRPDVMEHHVYTYAMCSPLKIQGRPSVCADVDFKHLTFLTDVIDEASFNKIWIELLAH
jgi:spermidine/putrescine transport system substrate-binding protein